MRFILLSLLFMIAAVTRAQHCPWDCGGMLLVKTDVSKENVYKLSPVMVDENKNIIVDTIYGTGKDTYDTCKLLYYDDFVKYRVQRTALHHWYQYDTVYYFAAGFYVIKTNFCEYKNKKRYLRLTDPYASPVKYNYIEIPSSSFIHLHEYNREIRERMNEVILKAVKESVLEMNCEKWKLQMNDCK